LPGAYRLGAEALDPDEITRRTGIVPDSAHRKGDLHRGAPYRAGQWTIESEGPEPLDTRLTGCWTGSGRDTAVWSDRLPSRMEVRRTSA
jgi:hypothetical protein